MHEIVRHNLMEIRVLCQQFGVARLDLFGSATTEQFDPLTSDVDFVVQFADKSNYFARYMDLAASLEQLLGREVDLVTENSLHDPALRQSIATQREPLYAA